MKITSTHTLGLVLVAAALASGGCAKTEAEQTAQLGTVQPGSAADFAATVGDRVFFETDQTDLTKQAQATLDRQATWLRRYQQYAFTVEGHADERGTREYNLALGEKRARTVEDYLGARGVATARMRIVSYGKERPVATCSDPSCWSRNRRAVIVLKGAES